MTPVSSTAVPSTAQKVIDRMVCSSGRIRLMLSSPPAVSAIRHTATPLTRRSASVISSETSSSTYGPAMMPAAM